MNLKNKFLNTIDEYVLLKNGTVYDPFIENSVIKKSNCFPIDFEEGLKIADFISVHIPLNEKTKNIIAKNQLMLMNHLFQKTMFHFHLKYLSIHN